MYLDKKITKNASKLRFRTPLPATTSKTSLYPYQKLLTDYASQYIKTYHPNSKNAGKQPVRFQEIYDGRPYLQLTIPIFNHRNEEKIIEVDCD